MSGGPQRMCNTKDGDYKDVGPGAGKAMDGSGPPFNKHRWSPENLVKKIIVTLKDF
jgi:hypothetical protein